MRRIPVLFALTLTLALAGCAQEKKGGTAEKNPAADATRRAPETAAVEPGPARTPVPETEPADPIVERSLKGDPGPAAEYAVMTTNRGVIKLRLFPKYAPKAVANFKGLAARGYYKGVTFHRVIKGFMMQGGDPTGTGRAGQSLWGRKFEDEFHPSLTFGRPGLLAMANSGPATNGSQFFITQAPTPHLDGKHTIFGEVMEGMDVVNAICDSPVNAQDKPIDRVVIESVTIVGE